MLAPQFVTFLRSPQPARSFQFYESLGLRLALDQGGCRIYQVSPSAYLGVCEGTTPDPLGSLCLTWVVEDVDGWFERFVQLGVPTDGPPRENPAYQIYHFFATDPDGYRLEVQRFLNPAWQG